MKFAHLGDCHLGGWRIPELEKLNFQCFQHAIDTCLKEKVDFVLIAGDLFDSAYPSIETIKESFAIFRGLKEANIPVFLIAGSHDYSASGKSFLDVLEKAGFATNVFQREEKNGEIILLPTIYKNIAIYGYPGKKSSLEVKDLERMKLQDAPGMFKILMLHTALRDAVGTIPMPAVNQDRLPKVDYLALAHLHMKYEKENRVYCGPTFPNNAAELEDLGGGSFYIANTETGKAERREIRFKEVLVKEIEITDALNATEEIISKFKETSLTDKILILKLKGILNRGKTSDINFHRIESELKDLGLYVFLKNTRRLQTPTSEINLELKSDNLEEEIVRKYQTDNPHKLNSLIEELILTLQIEKKEEENLKVFEDRLLSETKKVIQT